MKVHLFIIHHDNVEALDKSLVSYLASGVEPDLIHILDNGSDAAGRSSLAAVATRHRVAVMYSDENLGWGRAINRFIAARSWSSGDILGVSAHDAVLLRANWQRLAEEFEDPRVLFVCPQYPIPLRCEFSMVRGFRCSPAVNGGRQQVQVGHATLCFLRPISVARLQYDESCFIYGCESEIFLRAADHGHKTVVTDELIVENPTTDSCSEFRSLSFGINSIYIARLRFGITGYAVRVLRVFVSAALLALRGDLTESLHKSKVLLFALRSGGAGFRRYLEEHGERKRVW